MSIKNETYQSYTKSLNLNFQDQKIQSFNAQSSGSLPFLFIQSSFKLFDRDFPFFKSQLDYSFNLSYRNKIGWAGDFKVSTGEAFFRDSFLKKVNLKGRVQNFLLMIDEGAVLIDKEGELFIKKAEFFLDKPYFNLNAQMENLSSVFVLDKVLDLKDFPVIGDLTGGINCNGNYEESVECQFQGGSPRVQLQPQREEIFSIYDFNLDFSVSWNKEQTQFELSANKEEGQLLLEGSYQNRENELKASYSFRGDVYKDLRFQLPFDFQGILVLRQGLVSLKGDNIELSGFLNSSLLKIDGYRLANLATSYKFFNNRLVFPNIQANPGQSQWKASLTSDFDKKEVSVQMSSSLLKLNDFFNVLQDRIQIPFNTEGTGTVDLSFRQSWDNAEDKEFDIKGNFFNLQVNQDFFKQAHFELDLKNNKGRVKDFSLKKISAELKARGVFDNRYNLNIDLDLDKFRLENFNFLNSLFPFHQTGDMKGKLKMTGLFHRPEVVGDLFISNTFLYSYPIKDFALKIRMDQKGFFLTGGVSEEIRLDEFFYPFQKNQSLRLKGDFNKLDLIAFLVSMQKKNKSEDYRSLTQGSFDLEKKKHWTGVIQINELSLFKLTQSFDLQSPFSVFLEKDRWRLTPTSFIDNRGRFFSIQEEGTKHLLFSGPIQLGFFSAFFPFLENISAELQGQVMVNNNLKNLQPRGSFKMNLGVLEFPSLPEFKKISAHLIFSKDHLYINDLAGTSSGGGSLKGLGSIKKPFRAYPELDMNLEFADIHFEIPEGFNTKGNGTIKIKGSQPYLISGNYDVYSGSIVREFSSSGEQEYDFDLLKKEDRESNSAIQFDLNLRTKKSVLLSSSLIRSSLEGQAQLLGALDDLKMKGKFQLSQEPGQSSIFFRGQEFIISRGSISFLNSSPKNPYINISASSIFKERVIDLLESEEEIEREYLISLFGRGFAEDLKFSLRSTPTLEEQEIISLLTLGVSSRHFDTNVKQNVTDYSYQILASLLLEKPLNREIKEALGLDFRLTPYINTLNKPVTKITLSRTWFDKWQSSFSRTLEESAQSDIRLKYDISPKLSLTAFWENNEQLYLDEVEEDWLGFDFEFKMDF